MKPRLAPIRVESVGRPAAVSSLAALILSLANRPTLKVVPNEQPSGGLLPKLEGPQ
jgi:hypothetical protein